MGREREREERASERVRETVSTKGSCKAPLFCFAATACPPAPCGGCRVVPPRASCPGNRREEGREGERGLANVRSCQAVGFTPPMLPFCTGTPDGLFSPVSLLSPSLPLSLSHSLPTLLACTALRCRLGQRICKSTHAAAGTVAERTAQPTVAQALLSSCAPRSLAQVFIFPGGAADGPPRGPLSLHSPTPSFWRAVTAAPCLAAAVRLPLRPEILPCSPSTLSPLQW